MEVILAQACDGPLLSGRNDGQYRNRRVITLVLHYYSYYNTRSRCLYLRDHRLVMPLLLSYTSICIIAHMTIPVLYETIAVQYLCATSL